MKCHRGFAVLIFAIAGLAALSFAQKSAVAGGGYFYGGYGFYAAPVTYYPAPAYVAPVYAPAAHLAPVTSFYAPAYGGYAAPAPPVGGYFAPAPPVAPIGYGLIAPRQGLEIEYKYRHGLWYVDIDD